MSSCFMASPDCAKPRAPNSTTVDSSFTNIFFMDTYTLILNCFWIRCPYSSGPGIGCHEQTEVTGLLPPGLDEMEGDWAAFQHCFYGAALPAALNCTCTTSPTLKKSLLGFFIPHRT